MILCRIWRHFHKLGDQGKPAPPLLVQTLAPTLPAMLGLYYMFVRWVFPDRWLLSFSSAIILIFAWLLLEVVLLILTAGKSRSR